MELIENKNVALVGGFDAGREVLVTLVKALGAAKITKSVSAKADIVIHNGTGVGSNISKAKKLGVRVLKEKAFLKLVGKKRLAAALAGSTSESTTNTPTPTGPSLARGGWYERNWGMRTDSTRGKLSPKDFGSLSGLNVVLTGKFSAAKRPELEQACAQAGAHVMKSVGMKTDLVVVAQKAGTKFRNAIECSRPTISEVELFELLAKPWPQPAGLEGPLSDWLPRFLAMVKALRANQDIFMLGAYVGAPASEAKIKAAGKKLGGMPEALANLYRQCDGLYLAWIHKDHPAIATKERIFKTYGSVRGMDQEVATGGLRIPALSDLTQNYAQWFSIERSEDWTISWEGEQINHFDVATRLFPFDLADGYRPFFLSMLRPEDPYVFFGDDHGGDWGGSKRSSIEDYLEATLAHFGSYPARAKLYGSGAPLEHLDAPRAHWEKNPPRLEALLED